MTNSGPEYDQFQYWMIDMTDAIDRFISTLPKPLASEMDFSSDSLAKLEAWLLSKYENVDQTRPSSEAKTLDGAARYVGETFRRHLGGKWMIELDDPKDAFHGLPQLAEMKGQATPICPLTLVTTAISRRKGVTFSKVFGNHITRAAQ